MWLEFVRLCECSKAKNEIDDRTEAKGKKVKKKDLKERGSRPLSDSKALVHATPLPFTGLLTKIKFEDLMLPPPRFFLSTQTCFCSISLRLRLYWKRTEKLRERT